MNQKIIFEKYERTFKKRPPMLSTLSPDNEEYLRMLIEAIDENNELTIEDLAAEFMENDEALY